MKFHKNHIRESRMMENYGAIVIQLFCKNDLEAYYRPPHDIGKRFFVDRCTHTGTVRDVYPCFAISSITPGPLLKFP